MWVAMKHLRLAILIPLLVLFAIPYGVQGTQASPAPMITTNPTSGSPGSSFLVNGTGFVPNDVVTLSFNGVTGTTTATFGGTISGSFNVSPATPYGPYSVTASGPLSGTAVTTFQVTAAPVSNYYLTKSVTVSGRGSGTTAYVGDTLTYDIHYGNAGATTGSGTAVISDHIGIGQAFSTVSGPGCTPSNVTAGYQPGTTVTCYVPAPAAGTSGDIFITTQVLPNYSGYIQNQATMQIGSTVLYSNITAVAVPGPGPVAPPTTVYPVPVYTSPVFAGAAGSFVICGPVTAYTPAGAGGGSVTIDGQQFGIPPGTTVAGLAPAPIGTNVCLIVTFTGNVATSAYTIPNVTGIALVCGPVNSIVGGTVTIAGLPFNWYGTGLPVGYVPGQYSCFLLNGSGQIVGVLSSVPTSIRFIDLSPRFRVGHNWIE